MAKQNSSSKPGQKKPVAKATQAKPVVNRIKPVPNHKKTQEAPAAPPASSANDSKKLKNNSVSKSNSKSKLPGTNAKADIAAVASAVKRVQKNGQSSKRDSEPALRKTNLNPSELEEFRVMLMEKRRELIGDVTHLQNEAMGQGSSGESSGGSSMPIHMADLGSDTWEQELTLGLIENERGMLREIDEALGRIEDRTYGICMATNKPITRARLRAKPWAKHCIEYARKRELGLA